MGEETINMLTQAQCETNQQQFDEFKFEVKKAQAKLERILNEFNQGPHYYLTWILNEFMKLESFNFYEEYGAYSSKPLKPTERRFKKYYDKIDNPSYALDSTGLLAQLKTLNQFLENELPATPTPFNLNAKLNIANMLLNTARIFQDQLVCYPTPALIKKNHSSRWSSTILPIIAIAAFTAMFSFIMLNPITAAIVLAAVTGAALIITPLISVGYFRSRLTDDLKPRDHALKFMAGELYASCQTLVKKLEHVAGLYHYADENISQSEMYSALQLKRDRKVAALNQDLQALAREKVTVTQAIVATTSLLEGEDVKKDVERLELETTGGIANQHPKSEVVKYVKARFGQEEARLLCEKKEKLINDAITRHSDPDYLKAKYHKCKNAELSYLTDKGSPRKHAARLFIWGATKEQSVDLTSSRKLNLALLLSLSDCKKEADERRRKGYK